MVAICAAVAPAIIAAVLSPTRADLIGVAAFLISARELSFVFELGIYYRQARSPWLKRMGWLVLLIHDLLTLAQWPILCHCWILFEVNLDADHINSHVVEFLLSTRGK